jgi:polysaccharide export outer membrane protein
MMRHFTPPEHYRNQQKIIRRGIDMSFPRIVAICVAAVVTGCASGSRTASVCSEPDVAAPDYVISAGDLLDIFVWRNPEVSASVRVRPDGRISTPLVEDMVAAGKRPSTLARDMEAVLAEYLRSPTVNVIVGSPGEGNQIQVVGEVNAPQGVAYRESIRLLDVVLTSGGLGQFAAGNRAKVARMIDGNLVECSVRLDDLMSGDLGQNIRMYPGDVLLVPESRF